MGTTGPNATTLSFGSGGAGGCARRLRHGQQPGGGSGSGGSSRPGGGFRCAQRIRRRVRAAATRARPPAAARPRVPETASGQATGTLTAAQHDLLNYVQEHRDGARYVLATTNVYEATTYILRASADVLSVGGFTGQAPFPTLTQFEQYVVSGQVRYVYLTTFGGLAGPAGQTSQTSQTSRDGRVADRGVGPPPVAPRSPRATRRHLHVKHLRHALRMHRFLKSDGLREGAATDRSGHPERPPTRRD